MRPRSLALSSLAAILFGLTCAAATHAAATDLSGFAVVAQPGPDQPSAIAIAPNRKWFLTSTYNSLHLWDLETGAILRELRPDRSGTFTRVSISADGRAVFARNVPNGGQSVEETVGWFAETGLPLQDAASSAPPLAAPNWTWIEYRWPASWPFPKNGLFDLQAAKKYLIDQKIAPPVDPDKIERIEATDQQDVIQVTTTGEAQDTAEEDVWIYHVYFIDVVQKKLVADISGKTLRTFCGRPHGAFGFDGRHLVIAPAELGDIAGNYIDALLVDIQSTPPAVTWSRPCRGFQVSGMRFERGLIVVSANPDQVAVWDPVTARLMLHIGDIHDSDVLTWSTDLTTFATGFHDRRTVTEPHNYGVSVRRSGKKLFFPTEQRVLEIRLGQDGSKVFARTETGWEAWNASSNTSLPSFQVPAADRDSSVSERGPVKSPDGKFEIVNQRQLVECASGRVLVESPFLQFSEDFRRVWGPSSERQSIALWEAASGRLLWKATANGGESKDFLIMAFPDGRVRVSKSAEALVKLVRGFEVRPFDEAARRRFLAP